MVEKRRAEEKSFLMARNNMASAIQHQARAFGHAPLDTAANALSRGFGDDRPHLAAGGHARADFHLTRAADKQWHDGVRSASHQNRDRNRHAALTGRAI